MSWNSRFVYFLKRKAVYVFTLILTACCVSSQDVKQVLQLQEGLPVDHLTFEIQPQDQEAEDQETYINELIRLTSTQEALNQPPTEPSPADALEAVENMKQDQLTLLAHAKELKPSTTEEQIITRHTEW